MSATFSTPKDEPSSIERTSRHLRDLCDALEHLADGLPENVDRQTCLHLARHVGPAIARRHQVEEEQVFPLLTRARTLPLDSEAAISLLRMEQLEEVCGAEELAEVLLAYGEGHPITSPDTTGYILRGFFNALRRHIGLSEQLLGVVTSGDRNGSSRLEDQVSRSAPAGRKHPEP